MGKVVAIICEYNPFHNGHLYQIEKVKELIPDATIACIMSGNTVQRGEFALFDKYVRAKSAVVSGANAVFEIPYPYSASNAEIFAFAGVKIASEIGAEILCFGSETNDVEKLANIANIIDGDEFKVELQKMLSDKRNSYLSSKQRALKNIGIDLPSDPNDMLAIEYIRAINQIKPSIKPLPIKRVGAGYNDVDNKDDFMSATAIRKAFYNENTLLSIPNEARKNFEKEIEYGFFLDLKRAEEFLYMNTLRASASEIEEIYDVSPGVGHFIFETVRKSTCAKDFFEHLVSKNYTYARLRRIVMYFAFGIKAVEKDIGFANLLCVDDLGRKLVKSAKKTGFKIITKVADSKNLSEKENKLYLIGKKVDEIYYSLLNTPMSPSEAYKKITIVI